jgi:hypothetical protein
MVPLLYRNDLKLSPLRSDNNSGNSIFIFVFVAACGPLQTHFHRWGRYRKMHFSAARRLQADSSKMPFAVAAFLVKRQIGKIRRFFQFAILKINFR